ncbi:MAG: thiopurine S-methyltransferase [Pseudomonadota bacterium]|jgi:thiopurine S-methyltransferase
MQHAFWHEKWQSNQIGFHLPEVNKLLLKHWPALGVATGTVLVPLCGKSLDLIWLRAQGYQVIGVELSEIALDALAASFTDAGFVVQKEPLLESGLTARYRGAGVTLYAGDFFALTAEIIGAVDAIYDRAALVALPADMRQGYSKHLQAISQQAPMLLLSFDYEQSLMVGPPFAVAAGEIHAHYQPYYAHLDLLEIRDVIEQEPKFKERGLSSLKQLVYKIS